MWVDIGRERTNFKKLNCLRGHFCPFLMSEVINVRKLYFTHSDVGSA